MKALETKLRAMRNEATEPHAARINIFNWMMDNLSLDKDSLIKLVLKLDIRNHESIQLFLFNVEDLAS